jgi:hypothetical protein
MRQSTKLRALGRIKGLNFADCVEFFGERDDRQRRIGDLARQRLTYEGELEIDDTTVISEADDNGSYVMAWVWLGFGGVPGLDKELDKGTETDES